MPLLYFQYKQKRIRRRKNSVSSIHSPSFVVVVHLFNYTQRSKLMQNYPSNLKKTLLLKALKCESWIKEGIKRNLEQITLPFAFVSREFFEQYLLNYKNELPYLFFAWTLIVTISFLHEMSLYILITNRIKKIFHFLFTYLLIKK